MGTVTPLEATTTEPVQGALVQTSHNMLVVEDTVKVDMLRRALKATQGKLRTMERDLMAKTLECEKLHFRLEAVSFGDQTFEAVDEEWEMEQNSNSWTVSRVKQAVETRNVARLAGSKERRTPLVTRKPLATVIPKKWCRRKNAPSPPSKRAKQIRLCSSTKHESQNGSESNFKDKVTFADEKAVSLTFPVCVDDYDTCTRDDLSSSDRNESKHDDEVDDKVDEKVDEKVDDDDFAMDIIDQWTSALAKCTTRVVAVEGVQPRRQQVEETKQNDVFEYRMHEGVLSLREMMSNYKNDNYSTKVAPISTSTLNWAEILEC